MRALRGAACGLAIATCALDAGAQRSAWPLRDIGIRAFDQNDGLRSQTVYAITVTAQSEAPTEARD